MKEMTSIFDGKAIQKWLIGLVVLGLSASVLLPLGQLFSKAFYNKNGQFIGLDNFVTYFSTPALAGSLNNTLYISAMTTLIAVTLAFLFAYALTRSGIRGKRVFRAIALLPLFAPTMMHGIALTYLFGNQGLVTTGIFGLLPFQWDIDLYGPVGIILAEIVYVFPQAYLILAVSLAFADYQLYEAADTLGANHWRKFFVVTIPSVKYGIVSACFVCFTLSFTDFGAPKVVGGQFSVLATDVYKQVIGQQNMTMGATVGLLLIIPALVAFVVDRIVERKQHAAVTAKSKPYRIKENRLRDLFYFILCVSVSGFLLLLMAAVVLASFIKVWPYNLTLGLDHYDFSNVAGEGIEPLWNSILVALLTAVIGTAVTFITAYTIEKSQVWKGLRQAGYFLSILPLALPGMVIGLAYIFFFNNPSNPFHGMYGTIWILILANVIHFFAVGFITATSALKKLDPEFEQAAESMGVSQTKLLWRVTIPVCMPAIVEMAVYFFINSMVTISAVVFLYAADFKLASVSIVNMDDAGDVAPAAAMSVLIVFLNIIARAGAEWIASKLRKRTTGSYQEKGQVA
ncbi:MULTISPECIES: putative 2-aminoethylphosphonate ABC transporter permease subunit [Brevibacillus]|uniref:putative 2-aminoethylphosphonate ABC transporter permease subunit n=1 Tax=Brevibacillus TaxID=55080 RepID=UPI000D10A945|nr:MULTISPECIES: putative 2-aminoethylphosphonate ABC transporter permease subunit [Brevibacillus]MED1946804.1 putative 2-aminoethylphosphonate ABC transporter permease subunit [Brevibacillus formosus]MED1997062.1 putative 2-aminoethylphosphonate ABC transporter permease subunit [Brevibacillus formosus]MED2084979.1 putative 2-aminoethylphosphonate ABC transporter permease subunit [Brevibacillus formosus]PSK20210.1 putative 2-aminoethylphosphonate ABC transporter permease subunit [Brevibacillus 